MSPAPSRLVLENVPRITFYAGGPRCPEDICFPSVMRALMEYFQEERFGCRAGCGVQPGCKLLCSYAFFTGATGAAAYLSWKRGWHTDNLDLRYLSAQPGEVERRAFRAAGYEYELLYKQDDRDSEALFRQKIIKSIQKKRPAVAWGVIGPPEPALICGYDDDGATLIGWSFFQSFPEFNQGVRYDVGGTFSKQGWFESTERLLLVGDPAPGQSLEESCRAGLEYLLEATLTPIVRPAADAPEAWRERANGLAAYDAWAEQILRDEELPAEDEVLLRQRHDVHNNAVGQVAEARWYGALFLIQSMELLHYHIAEDLLHAAACYTAEHDLMWRLWELAGGNGNPDAYRFFADPAVRCQMAEVIRAARGKDQQAADHIRLALERQP